jgi:N-acetylglutamate synthase
MIESLEERAMNAWPGLQTVLDDGWVLRFANGYTRRANSIIPLRPGRDPVTEKIERCERLYQLREMPVVFKLPGRSEARALDEILAQRGYRADADTSMQVADLSGWRGESAPGVVVTPLETKAWTAAFEGLGGLKEAQRVTHRQILAAIVPEKGYALIQDGNQVVGCALGVIENGYVGIFDVVVDPNCRRQGYGRALLAGLLTWARQRGAHSSYLQVMLNNAPALALYAGLGFHEVYQYWYRIK